VVFEGLAAGIEIEVDVKIDIEIESPTLQHSLALGGFVAWGEAPRVS
jgi:hypothetical protein